MAITARWSLLAKVPWTARSSHCVAITSSGRVALYGGELKPRTPVDSAPDLEAKDSTPKGSVHILDLNVGQYRRDQPIWQTLRPALSTFHSDNPEPRVGATVISDGDRLYLWGGRGGIEMAPLDKSQAGIWSANLDVGDGTVQWEKITAANEDEAPEPRSYHAATFSKGKIYIHAGCPSSGRLETLDVFDISQRKWQSLAPAPNPVRGGTCLAAVTLEPNNDILLRYGGFSGYELPDIAGDLDVYSIGSGQWYTVQPKQDEIHGFPGRRSVHGFVPFTSTSPGLENAVALLYHGERDASTLGHAGAGTFWSDVWVLRKDNTTPETEGWAWSKVDILGEEGSSAVPEGRGWFPSAFWVNGKGNTQVVLQGGLLSSNERSDEAWLLEIV